MQDGNDFTAVPQSLGGAAQVRKEAGAEKEEGRV